MSTSLHPFTPLLGRYVPQGEDSFYRFRDKFKKAHEALYFEAGLSPSTMPVSVRRTTLRTILGPRLALLYCAASPPKGVVGVDFLDANKMAMADVYSWYRTTGRLAYEMGRYSLYGRICSGKYRYPDPIDKDDEQEFQTFMDPSAPNSTSSSSRLESMLTAMLPLFANDETLKKVKFVVVGEQTRTSLLTESLKLRTDVPFPFSKWVQMVQWVKNWTLLMRTYVEAVYKETTTFGSFLEVKSDSTFKLGPYGPTQDEVPAYTRMWPSKVLLWDAQSTLHNSLVATLFNSPSTSNPLVFYKYWTYMVDTLCDPRVSLFKGLQPTEEGFNSTQCILEEPQSFFRRVCFTFAGNLYNPFLLGRFRLVIALERNVDRIEQSQVDIRILLKESWWSIVVWNQVIPAILANPLWNAWTFTWSLWPYIFQSSLLSKYVRALSQTTATSGLMDDRKTGYEQTLQARFRALLIDLRTKTEGRVPTPPILITESLSLQNDFTLKADKTSRFFFNDFSTATIPGLFIPAESLYWQATYADAFVPPNVTRSSADKDYESFENIASANKAYQMRPVPRYVLYEQSSTNDDHSTTTSGHFPSSKLQDTQRFVRTRFLGGLTGLQEHDLYSTLYWTYGSKLRKQPTHITSENTIGDNRPLFQSHTISKLMRLLTPPKTPTPVVSNLWYTLEQLIQMRPSSARYAQLPDEDSDYFANPFDQLHTQKTAHASYDFPEALQATKSKFMSLLVFPDSCGYRFTIPDSTLGKTPPPPPGKMLKRDFYTSLFTRLLLSNHLSGRVVKLLRHEIPFEHLPRRAPSGLHAFDSDDFFTTLLDREKTDYEAARFLDLQTTPTLLLEYGSGTTHWLQFSIKQRLNVASETPDMVLKKNARVMEIDANEHLNPYFKRADADAKDPNNGKREKSYKRDCVQYLMSEGATLLKKPYNMNEAWSTQLDRAVLFPYLELPEALLELALWNLDSLQRVGNSTGLDGLRMTNNTTLNNSVRQALMWGRLNPLLVEGVTIRCVATLGAPLYVDRGHPWFQLVMGGYELGYMVESVHVIQETLPKGSLLDASFQDRKFTVPLSILHLPFYFQDITEDLMALWKATINDSNGRQDTLYWDPVDPTVLTWVKLTNQLVEELNIDEPPLINTLDASLGHSKGDFATYSASYLAYKPPPGLLSMWKSRYIHPYNNEEIKKGRFDEDLYAFAHSMAIADAGALNQALYRFRSYETTKPWDWSHTMPRQARFVGSANLWIHEFPKFLHTRHVMNKKKKAGDTYWINYTNRAREDPPLQMYEAMEHIYKPFAEEKSEDIPALFPNEGVTRIINKYEKSALAITTAYQYVLHLPASKADQLVHWVAFFKDVGSPLLLDTFSSQPYETIVSLLGDTLPVKKLSTDLQLDPRVQRRLKTWYDLCAKDRGKSPPNSLPPFKVEPVVVRFAKGTRDGFLLPTYERDTMSWHFTVLKDQGAFARSNRGTLRQNNFDDAFNNAASVDRNPFLLSNSPLIAAMDLLFDIAVIYFGARFDLYRTHHTDVVSDAYGPQFKLVKPLLDQIDPKRILCQDYLMSFIDGKEEKEDRNVLQRSLSLETTNGHAVATLPLASQQYVSPYKRVTPSFVTPFVSKLSPRYWNLFFGKYWTWTQGAQVLLATQALASYFMKTNPLEVGQFTYGFSRPSLSTKDKISEYFASPLQRRLTEAKTQVEKKEPLDMSPLAFHKGVFTEHLYPQMIYVIKPPLHQHLYLAPKPWSWPLLMDPLFKETPDYDPFSLVPDVHNSKPFKTLTLNFTKYDVGMAVLNTRLTQNFGDTDAAKVDGILNVFLFPMWFHKMVWTQVKKASLRTERFGPFVNTDGDSKWIFDTMIELLSTTLDKVDASKKLGQNLMNATFRRDTNNLFNPRFPTSFKMDKFPKLEKFKFQLDCEDMALLTQRELEFLRNQLTFSSFSDDLQSVFLKFRVGLLGKLLPHSLKDDRHGLSLLFTLSRSKPLKQVQISVKRERRFMYTSVQTPAFHIFPDQVTYMDSEVDHRDWVEGQREMLKALSRTSGETLRGLYLDHNPSFAGFLEEELYDMSRLESDYALQPFPALKTLVLSDVFMPRWTLPKRVKQALRPESVVIETTFLPDFNYYGPLLEEEHADIWKAQKEAEIADLEKKIDALVYLQEGEEDRDDGEDETVVEDEEEEEPPLPPTPLFEPINDENMVPDEDGNLIIPFRPPSVTRLLGERDMNLMEDVDDAREENKEREEKEREIKEEEFDFDQKPPLFRRPHVPQYRARKYRTITTSSTRNKINALGAQAHALRENLRIASARLFTGKAALNAHHQLVTDWDSVRYLRWHFRLDQAVFHYTQMATGPTPSHILQAMTSTRNKGLVHIKPAMFPLNVNRLALVLTWDPSPDEYYEYVRYLDDGEESSMPGPVSRHARDTHAVDRLLWTDLLPDEQKPENQLPMGGKCIRVHKTFDTFKGNRQGSHHGFNLHQVSVETKEPKVQRVISTFTYPLGSFTLGWDYSAAVPVGVSTASHLMKAITSLDPVFPPHVELLEFGLFTKKFEQEVNDDVKRVQGLMSDCITYVKDVNRVIISFSKLIQTLNLGGSENMLQYTYSNHTFVFVKPPHLKTLRLGFDCLNHLYLEGHLFLEQIENRYYSINAQRYMKVWYTFEWNETLEQFELNEHMAHGRPVFFPAEAEAFLKQCNTP